ncbi:MAG: hypothetical protein IJ836_02775 [Spirochaetales bacterium]|nr:hypothetical protein [Spirochaetales bacterium]
METLRGISNKRDFTALYRGILRTGTKNKQKNKTRKKLSHNIAITAGTNAPAVNSTSIK